MTKSKRIELLEEYIRLLEKECRRGSTLLYVHGFICPEEAVKEGERVRKLLNWIPHEGVDDDD